MHIIFLRVDFQSLLQHTHSVDFAAMKPPGIFFKHVIYDDSGIDSNSSFFYKMQAV